MAGYLTMSVKLNFSSDKKKAVEQFVEFARENLCEKCKEQALLWLKKNVKIRVRKRK